MPIDFARIAALFSARQQSQLKPIDAMFKRLGKWLARRMKTILEIEKNSRRFPVIVFQGTALAVWIDTSQHGALRLTEPPSFGEHLSSGGRAFVDGISRIAQSAREEWILPNLLEAVKGIFQSILSSIERFQEPSPSMFDPRQRTASDLFGLGALAYRSVISSTGQLRDLALDIHIASFLLNPETDSSARPQPAGPTTSPVPAGGGRTFSEYLDVGARYIMGAILILPALPAHLGLLIRAGWIRGRLLLINLFQGTERKVFELRQAVVDIFFRDLPHFIIQAFRFMLTARGVIMKNLEYFLRFGQIYVRELLVNIRRFADELTRYMRFWTNLVEMFRRFLEALMDSDLMQFIVPLLGIPQFIIDRIPGFPRLTLGNLLDHGGHAVRNSLKISLTGHISLLRAAVYAAAYLTPVIPEAQYREIMRKLNLTQEVVNQLFQSPAPYPAETARFNLPTSFPNIFDAFFGTGAPDFGSALRTMGTGVAREIGELLNTGADFLRGIGAHFQVASQRAARLGSPDQYHALAVRAQSTALTTFGGQTEELRRRLSERRDSFEEAFVSWLSRGGFHIVGAAIPLYVAEMRRYWHAQLREGTELTMIITPTSPHIIARRVSLGRVRMRRLVIRAPERELNSDLAERIALRFKGSVENAYVSGQGIIEQARSNTNG